MCQLTWSLYIAFAIYIVEILLGIAVILKDEVTPTLWPAILSFSIMVTVPFIILDLIIQG